VKINTNNFFTRRLQTIPPHFKKIDIDFVSEPRQDIISKWIYSNCQGRFGITNTSKSIQGVMKHLTTFGFEEPSDLTLFAIAGITQIKR
jgi:hypothetical protein